MFLGTSFPPSFVLVAVKVVVVAAGFVVMSNDFTSLSDDSLGKNSFSQPANKKTNISMKLLEKGLLVNLNAWHYHYSCSHLSRF